MNVSALPVCFWRVSKRAVKTTRQRLIPRWKPLGPKKPCVVRAYDAGETTARDWREVVAEVQQKLDERLGHSG